MAWTPIKLRKGGEISFVGEAEGAGSTPPHTRELLSGNAVTIANGAGDLLTWDTKNAGDDLLDVSNPGVPAVIASGVYAVAVNAYVAAPISPGGQLLVQLRLDDAGDVAQLFTELSPSAFQMAALTIVSYVPAGGGIVIAVTNNDGVNSVAVVLGSAVVQRLS